jgi:hypothetical protein
MASIMRVLRHPRRDRLYERGRRTKNSKMSRYKGRASRKTIEREFPHVVEIAVPLGGLGKRLDAMHAFHAERGIDACLGRGRHEDNQDYLRWYFANAHTAASFAAEFDGTRY